MAIPLLGALVKAYKDNTDKVLQWIRKESTVHVLSEETNGNIRVDMKDLERAADDLRLRSVKPNADIKFAFEYALQLRELVTRSHEQEETKQYGHCLEQTIGHRVFNQRFRQVYNKICQAKPKDQRKLKKLTKKRMDPTEEFPAVHQVLHNIRGAGTSAEGLVSDTTDNKTMSMKESIDLIDLDIFAREALTLDAHIGAIKEYWERASECPLGPSLLLLGYLTRGASNYANERAGGSKLEHGMYQSTLVGALRHIRELTKTSGNEVPDHKPTIPNLIKYRLETGRSSYGYEGVRAEDMLPFMQTCLKSFLEEYRDNPTKISTQGPDHPTDAWFTNSARVAQNPSQTFDKTLLDKERTEAVIEICWNVVQATHRAGRFSENSAQKILADNLPLANVLARIVMPDSKKGAFDLEFSLNMTILLETTDSWLWSTPFLAQLKRNPRAIVEGFSDEVLVTERRFYMGNLAHLAEMLTCAPGQKAIRYIGLAKEMAKFYLHDSHRDLLHSLPWVCSSYLILMHNAVTVAGLALCNIKDQVAAVMYLYKALRSVQLVDSIWFMNYLIDRIGSVVFGPEETTFRGFHDTFTSRKDGNMIIDEGIFSWSRFPNLDYSYNKEFREVLIAGLPNDLASDDDKKRLLAGDCFLAGSGYMRGCFNLLWPHFDKNDLEGCGSFRALPGNPPRYEYTKPNDKAETLPTARLNFIAICTIFSKLVVSLNQATASPLSPESSAHSIKDGVKNIEQLLRQVDSVGAKEGHLMANVADNAQIHACLRLAADVLTKSTASYTENNMDSFEWRSV
ncbi:hypothetical protein N0V83_008031 [Neocucurbitaria cava]|uniref:Uncharacterized protein n=1 Tax=Neocucurbitaria cava TaxID=798079 RepID=A0A9W8Y2V5_9PLEO|nr:hypothetical protein N0V83_008031 [Neocucurbitaria cava]